MDLVRREHRRIYTVGRLDAESTGLILLTNDGAIANVVCHPRYRIEKRYQVVVRGRGDRNQVTRVAAGVWLAEGKSSPAEVVAGRFHIPKRGETVLEMTLFEGRNREIRRVFAKVGLQVRRLRRAHIGPLELGELPPGGYRKLEPSELSFVADASGSTRPTRRPGTPSYRPSRRATRAPERATRPAREPKWPTRRRARRPRRPP